MNIKDLLKEDSIILNEHSSNKEEVIDTLIDKHFECHHITDKEKFKQAIMAREKLSSTGVGHMIAIPHAQNETVKYPSLVAMVDKDGVDFDSLDKTPVKLIFMIAVPKVGGTNHLEILAELSQILMDDKIIKKAIEEGVDSTVISERYIAECRKDMESLNVKPATTHPQATQEICGMLEMIGKLIEDGHAYAAADGTVYFRVRSFKEYGKLSHKNLDDLEGGKRSLLVSGEDQKEDPLDFVLWKPKKDGEPYWESPWCNGRPGWHIECSVMSKKYLGDEIDIHAGGEDLVFPHHENEIAQSEAANGKPFARYWMHNAFLNIDNKKMSKSAGNFFTVRDIVAKYDPQVVRFFMLSAHYRSPLNFSDELMEAAKNGLDRIRTAVTNLNFLLEKAEDREKSQEEIKLLEEAAGFAAKFDEAMDDDLNTADAIAAIFELVKFINTNASADNSAAYIRELLNEIKELSDVCGLIVEKKEEMLDSSVEALIEERQAARKAKNFARADEIRDELLAKGIILEDTREGVKWKRA